MEEDADEGTERGERRVGTDGGKLLGRLAFEFPGFASYAGVDQSPKLVAVGCRRIASAGLADRARLVVANCLAFDGPSQQYDVVGSLGMFPHVANPEAVLLKMVSHLRPGGGCFWMHIMRPPSTIGSAA